MAGVKIYAIKVPRINGVKTDLNIATKTMIETLTHSQKNMLRGRGMLVL